MLIFLMLGVIPVSVCRPNPMVNNPTAALRLFRRFLCKLVEVEEGAMLVFLKRALFNSAMLPLEVAPFITEAHFPAMLSTSPYPPDAEDAHFRDMFKVSIGNDCAIHVVGTVFSRLVNTSDVERMREVVALCFVFVLAETPPEKLWDSTSPYEVLLDSDLIKVPLTSSLLVPASAGWFQEHINFCKKPEQV
jgi:hypothetical protein